MRKPLKLLALAVTLITLGSLTAISQAAGGLTTTPRLFEVRSHPLTIVGRHFKPHSHVRVTLSSGGQITKRVAVKGNGRFTVVFFTALDRCTQWTVKVSQPGRAPLFVHGPKPQCTPASTP